MAFQMLVDDGRPDAEIPKLLQIRRFRGGYGIGQYQVRPELEDGLVIQRGVIAHIDSLLQHFRVLHIVQSRHGRDDRIAPQRIQEADIGRGHAHDAVQGRIYRQRVRSSAVGRMNDGLISLHVKPLGIFHPAGSGRTGFRGAGGQQPKGRQE